METCFLKMMHCFSSRLPEVTPSPAGRERGPGGEGAWEPLPHLHNHVDLYRRTKAAEGDLLVKLAEAQGTELENQALRGVGSENMVGLRMAEALKGTRVIVLPSDGEGGMNPLDLKTLLRRFDVKVE